MWNFYYGAVYVVLDLVGSLFLDKFSFVIKWNFIQISYIGGPWKYIMVNRRICPTVSM